MCGIQNELVCMMPYPYTCVGEPRAVVSLEQCQVHHFSLHQEGTLTSQDSVLLNKLWNFADIQLRRL